MQCVFFGTVEHQVKNQDDETTETLRVISPFWLFNLDQIDGIESSQAATQLDEFQHIDAVEGY